MLVKKWERLPLEMQIDAVRPYYEMLRKKNFSLFFKRVFDIFISFIVVTAFADSSLSAVSDSCDCDKNRQQGTCFLQTGEGDAVRKAIQNIQVSLYGGKCG